MSDHFPALCECHQTEFGVCVCGETLNFDGLCPNSGPPEREILQDLIAELRDNYAGGRMLEMADRAEARLREATNE